MHDRYAGKWYHTLTFTQTTQKCTATTASAQPKPGTNSSASPTAFAWTSAPPTAATPSSSAAIPPIDSATASCDPPPSITTKASSSCSAACTSIRSIRPVDILSDSLHFDLTQTREDNWKGRPVYVIGKEGANQLWIDQQNLCLVRMIKTDNQMDARFEDWQPFGGGFCETKCEFYINGKLIQTEIYHDMQDQHHPGRQDFRSLRTQKVLVSAVSERTHRTSSDKRSSWLLSSS